MGTPVNPATTGQVGPLVHVAATVSILPSAAPMEGEMEGQGVLADRARLGDPEDLPAMAVMLRSMCLGTLRSSQSLRMSTLEFPAPVARVAMAALEDLGALVEADHFSAGAATRDRRGRTVPKVKKASTGARAGPDVWIFTHGPRNVVSLDPIMKRSKLQTSVLLIWVCGFCCLAVIVLVAVFHYDLDVFEITPIVADQFESTFKNVNPNVGAGVQKILLDLARTPPYARNGAEFRDELKQAFPINEGVTEPMLKWLIERCAKHKASDLLVVFIQIYFPWLVIMLAGLLAEDTVRSLPRNKALASIGCSVILQLAFVAFLLNTLIYGDLNGTRDIELVATLFTGLVGVLVQFVFPSAPSA
jgi:hypothetical protein